MADAQILLGNSLRPSTLAINLLLDNVKHTQILQEKSEAREWITTSNKLLNSRKDRWMGICLLGCLVEQCDTELFTENCLSWLKTLTQIIQQEQQNVAICKYVVEILEKILSFSVQFSEVSRQISLTVIPSLLTAVLNEKYTSSEISLLVIRTSIQYYSGASGPLVKRIEKLIFQIFDSDDYSLIQIACRCFAILPKCGSSSSVGAAKQTASWEIHWKKILNTFSPVIQEFYDNHETDIGCKHEVDSETLQLAAISGVEPQRTETCVLRIKFLLKCLDLMLRNEFSIPVNIPLDRTVKVIQAILSVNAKSIKNDVTVESVLFKSSICAVHLSATEFLSSFILSCGMSLLPYYEIITRMLLSELSWSECKDKVYGLEQKYSELRSAVYDCVQYLVHVTSSVGENNDKIQKIIRHAIEDVKPRVTTTKLLQSTVATSKTPSHGKKAKRKRVQDDVSQLNRPEEKMDNHANRYLCLSGLQALNALILKGGGDIPFDSLQEVQVFVVTLLLECQQMSTSQTNYPIPYGSPECRKMLYNLLQTLLFYHHPKSPPPLQHAIIIFSRGTQDNDIEVSKFCAEAQMMCHALIHPRVPVISSFRSSSGQEKNNKQNATQKDSEIGQRDVNFGDGIDVEKTTYHLDSFTLSTSKMNTDEQSTSNKSLNKHNTLKLSKEIQHETEELEEEHGQQSEEITKSCVVVAEKNEVIHEISEATITENDNNIKRRLPEEFKERANETREGLSEIVKDDSPPEKRHKIHKSSTTEEGVLNNNDKDKITESIKKIEEGMLESNEDNSMEMISSFVDTAPDE